MIVLLFGIIISGCKIAVLEQIIDGVTGYIFQKERMLPGKHLKGYFYKNPGIRPLMDVLLLRVITICWRAYT